MSSTGSYVQRNATVSRLVLARVNQILSPEASGSKPPKEIPGLRACDLCRSASTRSSCHSQCDEGPLHPQVHYHYRREISKGDSS